MSGKQPYVIEIADVFLDAVWYSHDEFVEPSRCHADIVLSSITPEE